MDQEKMIPHLYRTKEAVQLMVDGKPFIILGGEVSNSSSSSLAYMERVWSRLTSLGLNTVLLPVSWELVEPEEDCFDFSLVDGLIKGAREYGLKLVFLWFGTWKNAQSSYVPAWVKTDLRRFTRAQYAPGKNSGAISCFCKEACHADAKAFRNLMRHIREVDSQEHTVIMMQVENEVGLHGASRDHCQIAEEEFLKDVPRELIRYLESHIDSLHPYLLDAWNKGQRKTYGTWTEVFNTAADEVFMAWHFARYIDAVADAGKQEYPIPMYVNAMLGPKFEGQQPGDYPSGGPVSRMIDVWLAAAPHIDILAPDIYLKDFRGVCREYARSGNPLFIPETIRDEKSAAYVFYAIGQHSAIGFAPFGVDNIVEPHPLTESYKILLGMIPVITKYYGTGRMIGFLDDSSSSLVFSALAGRRIRGCEFELGNYRLRVRFRDQIEPGEVPSSGLIIAVADDEYIVAGSGFSLNFYPKPGGLPNVEILSVDEGLFEGGKWVRGRRLNGDETDHGHVVRFGESPSACIIKVYSYE